MLICGEMNKLFNPMRDSPWVLKSYNAGITTLIDGLEKSSITWKTDTMCESGYYILIRKMNNYLKILLNMYASTYRPSYTT